MTSKYNKYTAEEYDTYFIVIYTLYNKLQYIKHHVQKYKLTLYYCLTIIDRVLLYNSKKILNIGYLNIITNISECNKKCF